MNGRVLDERGLRQVTTMLVALATLAERAANRSFPVRSLVLALLRYAERVARGLLAETAGCELYDIDEAVGPLDDPQGLPGAGNGPADALLLGWRLRALAALLAAFLPPDALPGRADGRVATVVALRLPPSPARLSVTAVARSPAFHDTS